MTGYEADGMGVQTNVNSTSNPESIECDDYDNAIAKRRAQNNERQKWWRARQKATPRNSNIEECLINVGQPGSKENQPVENQGYTGIERQKKELLGRAWGWDDILPYNHVDCWSLYKTYLQEFYKRNAPAELPRRMGADAAADHNLNGEDGNLPALINLCINVEGELLQLLKHRAEEFNVDEISLKEKLTNCAHQITNMECGRFPAPSIALKCILAEAHLLCELLTSKTNITSDVSISSRIRKFAFRFMTYRGSECFAAAAAALMMAATKEAKLLWVSRKNNCSRGNHWSNRVRARTLSAMLKICEECSAAEEPAGGITATNLTYDESDSNNCSEKEVICSKEELPNGNHLEERNEAKKNIKAKYSDRSASEIPVVDKPGETNEMKQMTKEELMIGANLKKKNEGQETKEPLREELMIGANLKKKSEGQETKVQRNVCR